jgi:hypothetical protein
MCMIMDHRTDLSRLASNRKLLSITALLQLGSVSVVLVTNSVRNQLRMGSSSLYLEGVRRDIILEGRTMDPRFQETARVIASSG